MDKKKEVGAKDEKDLQVERDQIATCYAQEISFKDRKKVKYWKRKLFRGLAIFNKTYDK